jgi:intein-encoded DNA endonuclease-like protein
MDSNYLAGFFDGEGSLIIRIRPDKRYKTGFQVLLVADITQKSRGVLDLIQENLKMGNIDYHKRDDLYQFRIYKIRDLKKFIPLIADKAIVKRKELEKFSRCVEIVSNKKHLTEEGLSEIRQIKCAFRPRN